MTNVGEWDKFRTIDMDKEANIIGALKDSSTQKRGRIDADKMSVMKAWHRIDGRTREALCSSFLSEFIEGIEKCIRAFIADSGDEMSLTYKFMTLFIDCCCMVSVR